MSNEIDLSPTGVMELLATRDACLKRLSENDDEITRLRADNARLRSLCDDQGRGVTDAAARLKVALDDKARLEGEVTRLFLEDDKLACDLQRHKEALEKARVALQTISEELGDMASLLMESEEQEDSTLGKAWRALLEGTVTPTIRHINEVLK